MAKTAARSTTVLDSVADMPPPVVADIEKTARQLGVPWEPAGAVIIWRTSTTATGGLLRRAAATVDAYGVLTADALVWVTGGDRPATQVWRRSRIDIADAAATMPDLPAEMLAKAGGGDVFGLTVRGDLGMQEVSELYLPLGRGTDGDAVRAALLGA
jgi:hypothetical protein